MLLRSTDDYLMTVQRSTSHTLYSLLSMFSMSFPATLLAWFIIICYSIKSQNRWCLNCYSCLVKMQLETTFLWRESWYQMVRRSVEPGEQFKTKLKTLFANSLLGKSFKLCFSFYAREGHGTLLRNAIFSSPGVNFVDVNQYIQWGTENPWCGAQEEEQMAQMGFSPKE